MKFVRAIWKLLVGIKDALVLLLMLLFFALLYAGLSARPDPVTDGVLALDLDGMVVEQPARAGGDQSLAELKAAIAAAQAFLAGLKPEAFAPAPMPRHWPGGRLPARWR